MHVVFIAAECEPWAKTGGLGDVVDALARAVGRIEGGPSRPVDVFLPRYRGIVDHPGAVARRVRVPDPFAADGMTTVAVRTLEANGFRLRLVDHPPAFDRDGYYGDADGDYPDNAWRFGLFCRTALETLRVERRAVDVLHLHDWHTAAAVILRDRFYADDPVVGRAAALLTLHNLAFHGWTPRGRLRQLGLAPGDGIVARGADGIDLLRAGIERSELVNTVSPTYAAQATTLEYGFGLDGVLRAKGDRFLGILNGLDTTLWDPATDAVLAAPYSRTHRSGKAACRGDLLRRVGFNPDDPGAIFGMIGRLDPQKGFDLLAGAAGQILALGGRLIVQGAGNRGFADRFREFAAEQPDQVALVERFDREMARHIYAGADLFLMPSRFEPCGQGQMIAMRYGTPPIVHATGGLADSVVDEHDNPGRGTGFAFRHPTPEGLAWACEEALALRGDGTGEAWNALVDRAMATNFGWEAAAAPHYVAAYERAVELRRSGGGRS